MTYKTVLVHVETAPDSALMLDNPAIAAFGGGLEVDACTEAEARDLQAAEAQFRALTSELGDRAVWRSEPTYPEDALLTLASAADLIIAGAYVSTAMAAEDTPARAMARASRAADLILSGGQPLAERDCYRSCDAEVMFASGRPFLAAPPPQAAC